LSVVGCLGNVALNLRQPTTDNRQRFRGAILAVFEKVRGEGMPQRVAAGMFLDVRGPNRGVHRPLDHGFLQVMSHAALRPSGRRRCAWPGRRTARRSRVRPPDPSGPGRREATRAPARGIPCQTFREFRRGVLARSWASVVERSAVHRSGPARRKASFLKRSRRRSTSGGAISWTTRLMPAKTRPHTGVADGARC